MTSTPVFNERISKEPKSPSTPRGMSLGTGVLYIVAAAGLWILALVLFHNVTARLLR